MNKKVLDFYSDYLKKKKDEFHVTEYCLQQTSLEQIFNTFAANQGKNNKEEEANIQLEENKGIVIDENLLQNLLD